MQTFVVQCVGVFGLAFLTACSPNVSPDDYFPTQEGLSWRYALQYEFPPASPQESRTEWMSIQTVEPGAVFFEDKTKKTLPRRRTSSGTDYYILRNEQGIYRAARRLIVENKAHPDPKARMILPQGENLRTGFIWSEVAHPYTVQWAQPFGDMNGGIKPFDMLYEVAALGESVQTPAGEFADCVRIEGYGKMEIYADPRTGYVPIDITQNEWYCPGVGLTKLVRDEPLSLDIITGGKVTFLLTRFEQ